MFRKINTIEGIGLLESQERIFFRSDELIEIAVGEDVAVLGEGDAYYFKSSPPHQFRNAGNEPCELITACSPPSF